MRGRGDFEVLVDINWGFEVYGLWFWREGLEGGLGDFER